MNRSKTADHLLSQLAIEKRADLLLLSEQYRNKESPLWYSDLLGTAAVWILNMGVHVECHGVGRGFVWIKSANVTYFSCYFTPNERITDFRVKLDALEDELHKIMGQLVVAGDFNARALEWGMPNPDTRGRLVLEMAARTGLLVLNSGSTTTFRRPGYMETIPDITLALEALVPSVQGWCVMEDYTGSDHQYIKYQIGEKQICTRRNGSARFNLRRVKVERFVEELAKGARQLVSENGKGRAGAEALVENTMHIISAACETSMPKIKPRRGRPPVYWWTEGIAALRKDCLRLRRKAQRAKNRQEANLSSAEHKAARHKLRRAINESKARCWRALVEDLDRDPWGLGYKLVTKKLGAQKPAGSLDASTMENVVRSLFPSHRERIKTGPWQAEEVPLFSMEELESAIAATKNGKAPGLDGIPSEALRMVFQQEPEMLLSMYNRCLSEGVFASRWKRARLVLIAKGKGEPQQPSSYRPLCMLDTAGKLLERLLKPRLTAAIQAAGDLSPNQYGFRTGRSTIDAIQEVVDAVRKAESHNQFSKRIVLLVTLDVQNAFNSAGWGDILEALENRFHMPGYLMRMLSDYLQDRFLLYETEEGQRVMKITAGAAQGSVLGPDLWNALYDGLLRLEMPDETKLIGYADDIAVLIAARDTKLAQLKLNQVMRKVNEWMSSHGLSLALAKTEIVILTKKRAQMSTPLVVGGDVVETKPVAKYLGVMIDSKMSFFEQIRKTADKAAKGVMALSRLMANTSGPKSSRRRLMMSATQSVLLYGAEIWADSLDKECYRKRLAQVQRRGALRVASAFRTVSEVAVLVIAGIIPIRLLAKERKAIYCRDPELSKEVAGAMERARTLERWQASWERETWGRWTARLIPNVGPWFERGHGEVGYYLTQFLSGHGYFREYLHKMGKVMSPFCPHCQDEIDNAEHTFFACDAWEERRNALEGSVGRWSTESAVESMLRGWDQWSDVANYVEGVLKEKKLELDRNP